MLGRGVQKKLQTEWLMSTGTALLEQRLQLMMTMTTKMKKMITMLMMLMMLMMMPKGRPGPHRQSDCRLLIA
jgi:hypothetical protein